MSYQIEYRQALRSISLEQVNRMCRLFFHPSRRVVVLMGPVDSIQLFKLQRLLKPAAPQ